MLAGMVAREKQKSVKPKETKILNLSLPPPQSKHKKEAFFHSEKLKTKNF
jgi:uracil DNA glycosylase